MLRQGHKLLLAGPSKAGKSFALIELCIAIAEGARWLGHFPCAQGRVLYINLELDRASCLHRFKDVYTALGIPPEHLGNLVIWNLRGVIQKFDQFEKALCSRIRKKSYAAVVLDPFYKMNAGNENNALSMVNFCNGLDRIAAAGNVCVIYSHHHSKGNQSWKRSMDRASGSGVFARDVDALLDITELELPHERRRNGITAWRIEGTLRDFTSFPPVDVWFNYPIHTIEHFGQDEKIAPHAQLPSYQRAMNARKTKEQKLRERSHRLEAAFDILYSSGNQVTINSLANYLGVNAQTVRNLIDENPHFQRDKAGRSGQIYSSE